MKPKTKIQTQHDEVLRSGQPYWIYRNTVKALRFLEVLRSERVLKIKKVLWMVLELPGIIWARTRPMRVPYRFI